jgi:hypothetical protein
LLIVLFCFVLASCRANEDNHSNHDTTLAEDNPDTDTASDNSSPGEAGDVVTSGTAGTQADEVTKIEISMEEAIAIGLTAATEYFDNLQLTCVYTWDADKEPMITTGEDGKRELWYAWYANEEGNLVIVLIVGGEVFHVDAFEESGNGGLIDTSEITVTSAEAVMKAKELGLRGGNPENEYEWVSGFNFDLRYASLLVTPDDMRLFLQVIGASPNGNFARIDFDAVTGELLLAEEQIIHEDGSLEWREFN